MAYRRVGFRYNRSGNINKRAGAITMADLNVAICIRVIKICENGRDNARGGRYWTWPTRRRTPEIPDNYSYF